MTLKADILVFLITNPHIRRINFAFATYKVYPTAYQRDVADAIRRDDIVIRTRTPRAQLSGAVYDVNYDSLELSPQFAIGNWRDQAFLIHECTHAHLDMRNLGAHSAHEDEAVAYLAEAVFVEAAAQRPLGPEPIRVVAHEIARRVLAGTYYVPAADSTRLVRQVAAHPLYAGTTVYRSNRFNRSWIHTILR